MQPASRLTVQGNFQARSLNLHGREYLLRTDRGAYYVTESQLSGKPWEHKVDYTLGGRRVQHYLTTLPDGRIVLLPPTWDATRKQWSSEGDIDNPEEAPGDPFQVWNKSCYGCHVSGERKNFDVQQNRYRTAWRSLTIDCAACHGPGEEHVAAEARAKGGNAAPKAVLDRKIVNPANLDAARSTAVCAQCHSYRDIYAAGFQPGAGYSDFFLPVMEYRMAESDDPAFWADGRPRWLSNSAVALWQSQCFLKGRATCVTCHSQSHNLDPNRNPQLKPDHNALCSNCHRAIAGNVAAHSHHAASSAGSSCVECHMPATVLSLNTRLRDHSISIPAPENTIRHGIPNACNLCHQNKDADWATAQMRAWYGDQSQRKLVRRADAFSEARKGDPAAIPALLAIVADTSEGAWIRANAAGYLGAFPNHPEAYDAVFRCLSDAEPLVRATATVALRPGAGQRPAAAGALANLLADPAATVRINAAVALVVIGVQTIPGKDGERFERAKQLYRARATLNADDAQQQFAAGNFFLLSGDFDGAVTAFRAAAKLDAGIEVQYDLARALALKGEFGPARAELNAIAPKDPRYAASRKLLAEIDAKENSVKQAGSGGDAHFVNGQSLYRGEYYGAALPELEEALRLAPAAPWAETARVYRAVCLAKLGRSAEAEAAMRDLAARPGALENLDLQLAYVELLYDAGRTEEALKRVDDVVAASPSAPLAQFWRAKVLLAMHRTVEAAAAAEQALKLEPELLQARNLLLRIYQIQGRTREAAQQAEWLRDYERRVKSK